MWFSCVELVYSSSALVSVTSVRNATSKPRQRSAQSRPHLYIENDVDIDVAYR